MTPASDSEYTALKKSAGLLDLSARGKIEVSGSDRVSFLHNILTQDIKNLQPGQSTYAALLSAPGKVLADMNVFVFENQLVLDTEPGLEKKLLPLLDKFLITEDAVLKDITAETAHLAVEGPKAVIPADLKFPFFSMLRGMTGPKAFHSIMPKSEARAVKEALICAGAVNAGPEALEIARIEWGWLRYGIDMDETVSLSETGLDEISASETKGCYPGQEVVARTKTYKGLQKKMVRLILNGKNLPKNGEEILSAEEKNIGRITSACYSEETGKNIALGYVAKGFFEKDGGEVFAGIKSEGSKARIQALSF